MVFEPTSNPKTRGRRLEAEPLALGMRRLYGAATSKRQRSMDRRYGATESASSSGRSRPLPRKAKRLGLQALGLCAVVAICYYAEQVLVVILASVLIAFVLAPVVDLFMRLRLPRWISSLLALLLLMSALGGVTFYGINHASNLVDQLPRYSVKLREKATKLVRKTQKA